MDSLPNDLSSSLLPPSDRKDLIGLGIGQLEIWLRDLIRVGLLQYDFSPESMQEIAARMVDAKLGSIARRLRRLASYKRSDPFWFHQVLGDLADMHLMVRAFHKIEQFPSSLQHTVYALSGYSIQKKQLQQMEGLVDQWVIMGIQITEEDNLKARYCWIMGRQSKRSALLLDFAFGRADFEVKLNFNMSYAGRFVYYPGSFPLRGVLFDPTPIKIATIFPGAFKNISSYLDVFALAVSKNPWLNQFPVSLENVKLVEQKGVFKLLDEENRVVDISNGEQSLWPLYASQALKAFSIFGIWDGQKMQLLSALADQSHFQISA
jgi:hypothetical protein